MPEIYVYISNDDRETIKAVRNCFTDALIYFEDSILIPITVNTTTPFVRIEVSIDTSDEDLIALADRFNRVIDVSVRFSWGPMVYRDKDQGFGHNAITEAKNKMRGILEELIYPDPNTA